MEIGRRTEDGRLDRAIDGAVRDMLDVEQPAGFRARVLRRIEGGDSPVASAFRRKILLFGVPLAAAAVLMLAVLLPRMRDAQSPRAPVTTAVNTQPQNPVVNTPLPPVPPEPGTTPAIEPRPAVVARRAPRPAPAATPRPDRVVAAASFEPAEPAGSEIAPLKAIEPIRMAPLAEHRIAPDAITVRALSPMNELQIAPLTPPGGRD
jgi:hypothetical protein